MLPVIGAAASDPAWAVPGSGQSRRLRVFLLVILVATGCGQATPSGPTVGVPTAGIPTKPDATDAADPDAELARAIAFRSRFGLRSDRDWVETVARDVAAQMAVHEFGFPLLPFEVADLASRRWDPNLLADVTGYGFLFPEVYAGAYINLEAGGVVVEFSGPVERHRTALANLLPDGSAVDVREVEWSLAELERFIGRVEADQAWFSSIGVTAKVGHRVNENWVFVKFKGRPDAERLIEDRFGSPSWLDAEWDGPPPWAGPRATLVIKVRDQRGRPLPGLWCDAQPVDPMVDDPGEDVIATDEGGICDLRTRPATVYRIRLHQPLRDNRVNTGWDPTPIKEFQVELQPGGTATEVVVTR